MNGIGCNRVGFLRAIIQNFKYAYLPKNKDLLRPSDVWFMIKIKLKRKQCSRKKWNLNGFWKICLIISYYYKQICQLKISLCLLMFRYVILQWGYKSEEDEFGYTREPHWWAWIVTWKATTMTGPGIENPHFCSLFFYVLTKIYMFMPKGNAVLRLWYALHRNTYITVFYLLTST